MELNHCWNSGGSLINKGMLVFSGEAAANEFQFFSIRPVFLKNIDLKLVSTVFYQIFISHQTKSLQKLWKMFFISSKKLFFSRDIQYLIFPSSPLFLSVNQCFRVWSKINFKVYDVINSLNKNLITHFIWYLENKKRYDIETSSTDRVSNKKHFCRKIMQKMFTRD